MTARLTVLLFSALLAGTAGAAAGDKIDVVRDLAGRVGPIVGSASACRDIARPRVQFIADKFTGVIAEASSNEAERSELTQAFDRSVADGRGAVTTGRTDCRRTASSLISSGRSPGPGRGQVWPLLPHHLRPPPLRRRPHRNRSPPAPRSAA